MWSEKLEISNPNLQNYIFSKEIAKGGMGTILAGMQQNLHREVALKKITEQDEQNQKQFLTEAIVTAFLDHPNILPIYELGERDGKLVIAMKLVTGCFWNEILHPTTDVHKKIAQRYDQQKHLEILISVCNAVAFAHSKKIIHNDLKPDNVAIGEFGEVIVMDWGVAVDIDPKRPLPITKNTDIKEPMGTAKYMAPELARGEGSKIGPWTDVFLLGAILYEILDGAPPYSTGGNYLKSLYMSATGNYPQLKDSVPTEICHVCYKAMQSNPRDRYQNVLEFQQAIQNFLEHRKSMIVTQSSDIALKKCETILQQENTTDRHEIYDQFSLAIAGYQQALLLWPENQYAKKGEQQARLCFAKASITKGDLGLAELQLTKLEETPESILLKQKISDEKQHKQKINARIHRLRQALTIAIVLIFIGLLAIINYIHLEQRRAAIQYADLYTQSLSEFRSLYTSQIVNRVEKEGIKITHDYKENYEIPYPATFSIELANRINAKMSDMKTRLYSDYPFPWRKDGGPQDEFDRKALDTLRKNSEKPYISVEDHENGTYLRFAKAVVMKENCVKCHNTHRLSPKIDWKVGDVRGVQEVFIPIPAISNRLKDLISLKIFLAIILTLSIVYLYSRKKLRQT